MADSRHLEKPKKSPFVHNRLTNFDEIWHGDASGPYALVKNSWVWKSKMADIFQIL